jgi:hypothetical protein
MYIGLWSPAMILPPSPPKKPFRQRPCKADNCGRLFFICSHCDRGQRYCSRSCQLKSRAGQLRAAQRRYLQSPEGRKDQNDRQRAYRQRKAALSRISLSESVIDQAPKSPPASRMITSRPVLASFETPWQKSRPEYGWVVCHFCGRVGRFLVPPTRYMK